jgi:hypothetical protein
LFIGARISAGVIRIDLWVNAVEWASFEPPRHGEILWTDLLVALLGAFVSWWFISGYGFCPGGIFFLFLVRRDSIAFVAPRVLEVVG